jgi:ubiquinone/menaquinone biosynthesis C-methylase UbiE
VTTPYVLLIAALLLLATAIFVWRVLARRRSIPCPALLVPLLENRIMQSVAGSALLIERAGVEPGMRVLDAGCGPGRVTIPLARHVGPQGSVVALDIQAAMLERLAKRIEASGPENIEVVHAGLGQGTLAPEQFDRAIMVTVLGEIPDRLAALQEIYGALNPRGLLSITEVLPDPHYQTQGTVRKLAESAGFSVETTFGSLRSFTMNLVRTDR